MISIPDLPREQRKTAMVVDAMLHNDETFGAVERRNKDFNKHVPVGTSIVHFCCGRYISQSLKPSVQQRRYAQSGSRSVSNIELLIHRSFLCIDQQGGTSEHFL